ncbi:MAG: PEP-CTERM sorting domain-containing protein [Phycisphaerales bacterium]|nr:PEP-CTERM sorting domain-containing protein [Phycisphaerales bacterium]
MKYTMIAMTAAAIASAAGADTLDFSDLNHGDVVSDQYAGLGVNISTVNFDDPANPNLGVIFDTSLSGTADGDLEDPFSLGNTDLNTDLGNILIISEDGSPNDEGSRPAGTITFTFDMLVESFGFHVVDLESETIEESSLDFYRDGSLVETVDFEEFLAGGDYDNGVIFGNNSINLINEFTVDGGYDELVINVGGSMGFDNITYTIPAPGALALIGLGAAVGIRRRR